MSSVGSFFRGRPFPETGSPETQPQPVERSAEQGSPVEEVHQPVEEVQPVEKVPEPIQEPQNPVEPQEPPPDISKLSDKEKWAHSKKRWNRYLEPDSPKFRTVYQYFVEQLKTRSPDAVVRANFASHEVRKFLNGFVDKKRLGAIHKQQKREKLDFRRLRDDKAAQGAYYRQDQFPKDMQNLAPLPLKLAMMYFGFPVEPMTFTDPLQTDGTQLFANLNFASVFDDDEDEDFDDEDLSFVPEELRPLRFLNYYDRLGYGKDNSHSQCARLFSYLSTAC